jgi:DNA-binding MarR family transcriptional regulator
MARSRTMDPSPEKGAGLAFLLSQVGAHAAFKFAEYLGPLGLKPPDVGILKVIREANGLSQQALGERLGIFPSRLVAVIDELERRGLVERRDSPIDRRSYALFLTEVGSDILNQIEGIARKHQETLCAALSASERAQLAELLTRIAAEQGLTPGVHPGYRKLGALESRGKSDPACGG